jgi:hypothetical protein
MERPVFRRVLTIAVLMLGVAGCRPAPRPAAQLPPPVDPGATVHLNAVSGCGRTAGVRVFHTAAEWEAWTADRCPDARGDAVKAGVDFAREMLVAAASGSMPSGGRSVRVERAGVVGDSLRLLVRAREVRAGCPAPAAVTSPLHVVRMPLRVFPVAVETVREEHCDGG